MGTKAMGVTAVLEPVSGVGLGVGDGQTALRVPVLGAGEGLEARAHTPGKWKVGRAETLGTDQTRSNFSSRLRTPCYT